MVKVNYIFFTVLLAPVVCLNETAHTVIAHTVIVHTVIAHTVIAHSIPYLKCNKSDPSHAVKQTEAVQLKPLQSYFVL